MPWNETSAMDQRMHFIADYLEDYFPFSELCRRYGISRPTGYKWVQRYVDTGAAGLMAQSRRPVRCPHATSSDLVEAILEARRTHPTWGAKKLLALLWRSQPHRPWPARTPSATSSNAMAWCRRRGRGAGRALRGHPRPP